jgi:hypothetical protein
MTKFKYLRIIEISQSEDDERPPIALVSALHNACPSLRKVRIEDANLSEDNVFEWDSTENSWVLSAGNTSLRNLWSESSYGESWKLVIPRS